MKKQQMLAVIERAALRVSREKGSYACVALYQEAGQDSEVEELFSSTFLPSWAMRTYGSGLVWTFDHSNEALEKEAYTPGTRELALCFFHEMVRCGDV